MTCILLGQSKARVDMKTGSISGAFGKYTKSGHTLHHLFTMGPEMEKEEDETTHLVKIQGSLFYEGVDWESEC
jgi:hypothetical protein